MRDKIFLDTNIILYVYSVDEPDKQSVVIKVVVVDGLLTIVNPFK